MKHTKWVTVKAQARDARLRREYGITLEQSNACLAHQDGRCAICKRPVKDFKNNLAVDHCHTTGLVRGLLCWHCNKLIGVAEIGVVDDYAEKLLNASIYLRNPPMVAVHGEIFTAPGRVGTKKRAKLLRGNNETRKPVVRRRARRPRAGNVNNNGPAARSSAIRALAAARSRRNSVERNRNAKNPHRRRRVL